MNNLILPDLYNKEFKDEFLDTLHNPKTIVTYRNTLRNFSDTESQLQKDLCYFSTDEIKDTMDVIGVISESSVNKNISIVNSYKKFAVTKGLLEFNDFDSTLFKSEKANMVSVAKNKNQYFKTEEEFLEIFGCSTNPLIVNAQDRVVCVLLWNGIKGEELSEMLNLTKQDCDFENNTVRVMRDNQEVIIQLKECYMKVIAEAIDEQIYYAKNGNSESIRSASFQLAISDTVIRGTQRRERNQITRSMIYRRIKETAVALNKRLMTATSIYNNGLMNKIYMFEQENDREVTDKEMKSIMESFGRSQDTYYSLKNDYTIYKAIRES